MGDLTVEEILAQAEWVRQAEADKKQRDQDRNRQVYEEKNKAVHLLYAPLPRVIIQHAKTVISEWGRKLTSPQMKPHEFRRLKEQEDELLKYTFRFVAHLLAHSSIRHDPPGWQTVDWAARSTMADTKDTKKLASMTQTLVQLGFVERDARSFNPDEYRHQVQSFRLPSAILDLYYESDDLHHYGSLRDYGKRQTFKPTPSRELHQSFDRLPEVWQDLAKVTLALQERPLWCDWSALMDTWRHRLTPDERKRWMYSIAGIRPGPNYTRYTLAESGRLYTFAHNLQGIPKALRRHFYPSDPEFVFLDLDYRSQESWILAHLSGDEAMLEVLSSGDIYMLVANAFGWTRNQAKAPVNSYHYGAGARTLARQIHGLPENDDPSGEQLKEAERFMTFMRETFSAAARWMDETAARIAANRRAEVPTGLVRDGIVPSEARRVGLNHEIQGRGALMLWHILRDVDACLADRGRLVLPMHDGLLVEVRQSKALEVEQALRHLMNDAYSHVLPGLPRRDRVEARQGWRRAEDPELECNQRPASR